MSQGTEIIVRYTRLRDELKPVAIYRVDPPEPINPDWAAITQAIVPDEGRINPREGFCIYYLSDDGEILGYGQYDSLEIAVDQANAIAGIRSDEWRVSHVELRGEYDTIPWSHERSGR